jgi:hypothetical protein
MTAHVDRAIERYFAGEIARAADRDALFGHLDRCDQCRKAFDSEADLHRSLAGSKHQIPATELALIAPALLDSIAPDRAPKRWWTWAFALAPIAAALLVAIRATGPAHDEWSPKGSAPIAPEASIEVLCFDEKANVVQHLKQDGRCPAPGFLKVVYASPRSVPHLTVAAFAGDEVRLYADLSSPEPRSVVADYAKIARGDRVRVIAVAKDSPVAMEVLRGMSPSITVSAAE